MSVPTIVWLCNNEIIQKNGCVIVDISTEKKEICILYEGMILIVLVTKRLREIIDIPHCLFVFD